MAFPDAWMHELLSKNDIVSVIGEYASLTPRGGKLWARCPFHNEKTASFTVSAEKQLYYCFGCHAGGGVIQFIMGMERLTYFETISFLARRVGMELPDRADDDRVREQRQRRERLYAINKQAALFYHFNLMENGQALEYLRGRGVTPSMIKRFGLGIAPDGWDGLCDELTDKGYTREELIVSGLARAKTETAKPYDAFRNRIMFPVVSEMNRVVGFGARTMGNENPKYLNTGETPVFNKRYCLYGLNLCKRNKADSITVVEGYMDVISLSSAGIDNAVASLGTALTPQQARLIKRYTENVYIAYDGDAAGQSATARGLDILAAEGLNVRVLPLPDGLDPDDFVRKYGADEFLSLRDKSLALNAFKIERIAKQYCMDDAEDRQKFAIEACELIAGMQPVEREIYYEAVSRKTGLSLSTITEQGERDATERYSGNTFPISRNNREKKQSFARDEREKRELTLAACAAANKTAARLVMESSEVIKNDALLKFVQEVYNAFENSQAPCVSRILSDMPEPETARGIAAALSEQDIQNPAATAAECITGLKMLALKAELMELSVMLDTNEIRPDEYARRFNEVSAELKRLQHT